MSSMRRLRAGLRNEERLRAWSSPGVGSGHAGDRLGAGRAGRGWSSTGNQADHVETMMMLIGDRMLQYEFVESMESTTPVSAPIT